MIFFVAPEVSLSSYYLNRQAIHCKSSTVLDSGGNYFLRHQDFHWQLVSEQPIWESLSFFRSQESRGQAVLSLVSAICLLPCRGAWNAPREGGRCAQTEAGWREGCVPHREPWGRSAFFGPPLPVIPVTSAGPAVCSRMQKWMRRILAYSYKVREWRAGVYTRESSPESVQFWQSLSTVLLPWQLFQCSFQAPRASVCGAADGW